MKKTKKNSTNKKNSTKKNSVAPSFPLFIGAILAAVAFSQDNRGGAVLAVVAGAVISLVLYVLAGRRER